MRGPKRLHDRHQAAATGVRGQERKTRGGHARPRDQSLPSCTECYRRKKRCNHDQPCSNCARRYPPVDCVYTRMSATREPSNKLSIRPHEELQSFITPFPEWQNQSSSSAFQIPSPLSSIEDSRVNRVQLLALNCDFLSLDSIYNAINTPSNTQSLYKCLHLLINNSNALDVALQALCLIQLSIRQQDQRLKEESLVMKIRALRELSMSLTNTQTAYALETLAASLCLKTYGELSYDPETLKQINIGTRLLVKQRGPSGFVSAHAHSIFVRWFREYEIYYTITLEIPTFLAEQDWCTIPWTDIQKTDADFLIDIIAEYAAVRHQVASIDAMETSPAELLTVEATFRSCRKLDKDLGAWLDRFEKKNPEARLPALPSNADLPSRLIFPLAYQFKNLKVAMLYLKYWATHMLLHSSLRRIDLFRQRMVADVYAAKSPNMSNMVTTLFPAFDYPGIIQHARDICQSLDYVLGQTMNSSGPLYVTYPIVVAYFMFMFDPRCGAETECCAKMMKEMGASGYDFTARYPENMRDGPLSLRQNDLKPWCVMPK